MANIIPIDILANALSQFVQNGESTDIQLIVKGKTATAIIKDNETGTVLTQKMQSEGLQQWSSFNPRNVPPNERRQLVHRLITEDKLTQSEVAAYLGISQSQVSKDFNQEKKEK